MCNAINCSHDFDDQIDDIFGGDLSSDDIAVGYAMAKAQERFKAPCRKCNGTGRFVGYTGRVLGNCFTCGGKGFRLTKTDPAVLEANREKAAAKKAEKVASISQQANDWLEANPNEAQCLREAAARGFEFAQSMLDALFKYGHLTEKQEASVRSMTEKSLARKAQWAAERAEREANKAEVNIDRIAEAFASAKAARLKFPKLRLDDFTFSLAGDNSRNAGSIYVKQDETYLGKIADGKFTRSRDCTAEIEARIVSVCADPAAAAEAYGKRTGQCACCGRELTNEESIARSIGPICAQKWGW